MKLHTENPQTFGITVLNAVT